MATNAPTQVIITDTFSQQVDKINTLSLDLGATGRLLTNQDSDTISAINEHDSAIRGTNTSLVASVLTTTKKNLVDAINELDSDVGANPASTLTTTAKTITGALLELDSDVGVIASLSTTNKSSIVASINELFTSVNVDSDGKNAHLDTTGVMQSLENLDSAVGNLSFGTTFPASVVDLTTAVNNVRADLSLLDSDNTSLTGRLGSLANLDSAFIGTERTSMVNALNALRADIALIFDENGTQLN
tara:strand:+ start:112 stop:846 length:735 start_codon:yes stop_codon:yes gene_type:complete